MNTEQLRSLVDNIDAELEARAATLAREAARADRTQRTRNNILNRLVHAGPDGLTRTKLTKVSNRGYREVVDQLEALVDECKVTKFLPQKRDGRTTERYRLSVSSIDALAFDYASLALPFFSTGPECEEIQRERIGLYGRNVVKPPPGISGAPFTSPEPDSFWWCELPLRALLAEFWGVDGPDRWPDWKKLDGESAEETKARRSELEFRWDEPRLFGQADFWRPEPGQPNPEPPEPASVTESFWGEVVEFWNAPEPCVA